MKSKTKFLAFLFAITTICGFGVTSAAEVFRLKVSAPKVDCADVPVGVTLELPESLAGVPAEEITATVEQTRAGSMFVYGLWQPAQVVMIGPKTAQLWWIAPQLRGGETSRWRATLGRKDKGRWPGFCWQDKKSQYLDLLFAGQRVTRYMYAYDRSSPQRAFETYKPFHHVFDGEGNLLTNGPDGVHPYLKDKIKYPHHRGIFIGWNRLEFGGQRYDLWHMAGVAQVHQRFLELIAGPVLARSKSLIHWNDKNGEPIIAEERQVTVFRQSEIILLEFRTELKAVRADVYLAGDPEHGGFQYRAHNDVASGGKEVKASYLFHEDGINPRQDTDLPWVAMSYGLNGRRYTVLHMNHPSNPRETVYSAYRDYGRFGAFFKERIKAGEKLTLCYRIGIGQGEMPKPWPPAGERQEPASIYSAFTHCPQAVVLDR